MRAPRVVVVGSHPDLGWGFEATMSISQVVGFCDLGCSVMLLLPERLVARLEDSHAVDLRSYGRDFEVAPLSGNERAVAESDLVIWQSYTPSDGPILDELRSRERFVAAKSFPRFFSGIDKDDRSKWSGTRRRFDIVGFALREDLRRAQDLGIDDGCAYVPRGFVSEWLSAPRSSRPTISVDVSSRSAPREWATTLVEEVARTLHDGHPELEVRTLGFRTPSTTRIQRAAVPEYYSRFLNQSHALLAIDDRYPWPSRVTLPDGSYSYLGTYENTVIEAQLAGVPFVASADHIAEELRLTPVSGRRLPEFTTETITHALGEILEHHGVWQPKVQQAAREGHDVKVMCETWLSSAGLQAPEPS